MIIKENIKTFVQQTLGCACPEEVFKYIDCQSNIKLNDIVLRNKIHIGNRLLIYVVEVNSAYSIKDILPYLIEKGRKERDSLKFNRFRLVIATDDLDEIKEISESLFKTINKDEKVHLHIVAKDRVPLFSKMKIKDE